MRFLSNFECKIILMCSVNFWHQRGSNPLFKGSTGHVTSQCKQPILGGGVPPGSRNSDLFQTKKCHFPHPCSVLASKIHYSFQTLEEVTKRNIHLYKDRNYIIRTPTKGFLKIIISNSHIIGLFLIQLEPTDKYVHTPPQVPRKLYPNPDQNGQSLYQFTAQNGSKSIPLGAAHTYMAYGAEPHC